MLKVKNLTEPVMIPHMINEVKWTTKYESMSYLVAAAFLIHFEASQVIWDKEYNHPRKKGGTHSMTY